MNCYLIESFSPDIKFKDDDLVIALTPLASYQLDKAGVKYQYLEDYYDESEFMCREEEYYYEQLKWFERYDNLLLNYFPKAKENNIKLASNYYLFNKVMVDSIVQRCQAMDKFMIKTKVDSITYVSYKFEKENMNIMEFPLLFQSDPSLFYRTTPLICKKYKIKFKRLFIENKDIKNNIIVVMVQMIEIITTGINNFVGSILIFIFYLFIYFSPMKSNTSG